MYRIELSKLAEKQLYKFTDQEQKRIIAALKRIRIRPHAYLKKLVGSNYFRLRIGDLRAVVDIQQGKLILLVIEIKHRKNIYK